MTRIYAARDHLLSANYFAPRGKGRLYELGKVMAERYLYPSDLLIGVIGGEGSGKSTLIRGLFPGLELTNDDEGINISSAPIYESADDGFFTAHTFHIDARYERAFRQTYEIVAAIKAAVRNEKRVVVEHFDLVYEQLGHNAQVLISVGEEVRLHRPTVFGPSPLTLKQEAEEGGRYRIMAHTAEDITTMILISDYGYDPPDIHSEVRHGFVIGFPKKLDVDIAQLEEKVRTFIEEEHPVKPAETKHIMIGDTKLPCTGRRIHVKNTRDIENFRLLRQLRYDPVSNEHLLVGLVGKEPVADPNALSPVTGEDEDE
ncbi:MAG: alanine-tRNA synthetase second additional domain-containing protein [Verrucomicrobiota bacterium]